VPTGVQKAKAEALKASANEKFLKKVPTDQLKSKGINELFPPFLDEVGFACLNAGPVRFYAPRAGVLTFRTK